MILRATMREPTTYRPFVFTAIEDDGVNVTIEVSEEDYQSDLGVGIDEEDTLKPGRHKMKRGGFLARHPEVETQVKQESWWLICCCVRRDVAR